LGTSRIPTKKVTYKVILQRGQIHCSVYENNIIKVSATKMLKSGGILDEL
jgi:hypothetical protein